MRNFDCHSERSEESAFSRRPKQIPRRFAPRKDVLVLLLLLFAFSSAEAQRRRAPVRKPARAVAPAPKPTGTPRFEWFEYRGRDSAYLKLSPKPDEYVNPVLAGFYPDPSIERVGDDYYLVTSSFAYFPGVPIFHSKNLVDWTQIGSVLDRPSQLNLDSAGISRGIFAPVIRYNDGKFYMITTLIDRGGNFIVTATNPAGPWSNPVWLKFDGIDPSLFFDDNGKAYIVNNGPPIGQPLYNGHRAIWIQEFNTRTMTLVGSRDVIVNGGVDLAKKPIWIEAPHILKVNGKYYLICAEGGTADQHSEVVFRADDVRGPYLPYSGNPILTQRQLDLRRPLPVTTTGHADFVQTPSGEWWSVFLGVRPYEAKRNLYNNGRETYLLPVRWVDGWPHILDGNATVPYLLKRPSMPSSAVASLQGEAKAATPIPTAGNFVVRDEFDAPSLAPYWNMIRTPRSQWYDLTSTRGALTIQPRPEDIGGKGQPSFIGRRQQHIFATASTSMLYAPEKPGDRAGLAAFHNEDHYYLLTVTRVGPRAEVQLERRSGAAAGTKPALIASAPLTSIRRPIELQIRAKGGRYDFLYATTPGKWKLLAGDLDGTVLSTPVAGGFVGTMFGMYAYSAP